MGVSECGNYTAGIKAIAALFPAGNRASAGGLFNAGAQLGSIVATPLVVLIATRFGWRPAFLISALSPLWLSRLSLFPRTHVLVRGTSSPDPLTPSLAGTPRPAPTFAVMMAKVARRSLGEGGRGSPEHGFGWQAGRGSLAALTRVARESARADSSGHGLTSPSGSWFATASARTLPDSRVHGTDHDVVPVLAAALSAVGAGDAVRDDRAARVDAEPVRHDRATSPAGS